MALKSEQQINAEYIFAISQLKELAEQYDAAVPGDLKQRIKDGIRYAANQLEMMGVPKRDIVSKLYADLGGDEDSFYKLRNIYYILDSHEYDANENANLQKQNTSIYILPENVEYDLMLARAEGVIKQARSKMSKPFVSLMDKKEYRHTLATGNGLLEMAENSLDERQLTHVPLINFFIQLAIKYTAADAYSHYYTEVKDLIKKMTAKDKIRGIRTMEAMSGKQAHETVYLRIKDIHYSLEPTDEHEARAAGFSGERCPSCKSWRTEREPDATNTGRWYICIHCDHKFERKQPVPFTKPNAVVIDEAFITSHMSIERSAGVRSF